MDWFDIDHNGIVDGIDFFILNEIFGFDEEDKQILAKIALEHINNGHRVLMLSYSNVSVDGAVLRVHKLQPDLHPGTIVRYGYARQEELLNHKFLTSYNLAIHNHPELLKERKDLIAERKKLPRTSRRYVEIGRRLSQIKDVLSSEEKETIKNARFVATTVSKAVVDSAVRECDFDVVIFDEASMAYIPQIVFAASLANKHFICMGDFRQLPPIVQGNSTSPLNADIFQYCGITAAVDSGRNHKWLCMLDTGYPNCHETGLIDVEFVEQYFYRNGKKGQHCMRCNCSLEAKLGQYGLYIQCCGAQKHRYKLDEI